ncbi:uncharacterized protein F4822DRAFT_408842 [Hypoxylon trugodes]|uniref:uncharacterized protein n=1 Tax=Hypoxylon trugodes TaxID=326681 RepID=UPI00219BEDE9|nr:uncharacterized protein F4822DRAFT_408842 [Hypoxylon trugodes]KAI1386062.1 hypothetical protein F4822DRAFT_408842 [Hypoxylon trugodes]
MSSSKEQDNVEEQAFLAPSSSREDAIWSREKRSRKTTQYLRLTLEIVMGVIIAGLLVSIAYERVGVERPPVPKFPRKIYTFLPDPQYVRDDMLFDEHDTLHSLHNWIPLSADARGYVQVPDYDTYGILGKPFMVALDRTTDGPAFMMSVFHQLHCLSYIVEHYQQGYAGVNLTGEVAHHSAHCFDYLRQSIMCAGDTNLESETEAGPGWGSKHECVDYDVMLDWANKHSTMKWRNGLMPGESVL